MELFKEIAQECQNAQARLVAVSKTKPISSIESLYAKGQRIFGENKVQELCQKQVVLPSDIEWHMIGHLQSNKVKYIAPFVDLIHAVDSIKLLKEINKQARNNQRIIHVLLQIKIASEESKYGINPNEFSAFIEAYEALDLSHVSIVGLMGMATFTEDKDQIRKEFQLLQEIFEEVKRSSFMDKPAFKELSMGMSGDYKIALEEGSTMIRIGSLLFGHRTY